MEKIILYYLLAASLVGLFLCWLDKRRARRHAWRIPEKTLFGAALFGGGAGVWAGMYLFRHKTKRWYFVIGIPLITLAEYGLLLWLWSRRLK